MPRITRIHLSGVGHRDARFPALTLDLRGPDGKPADTVVWAENGVGKSSILTLFFSCYQTGRRQFLGARGVAKARDLEDYVSERDLSFVVTEWDITEDRTSASLLPDEPRELLVVGQVLSWKGLDRGSGDLRRLFFTLKPNREVDFDRLPITGLGEPVKSFESFRDWLNNRAKEQPKLEIVHETNQGEWRSHLEACHLDSELFAYQLRMNLDEGGVNELFNELKEDKDFFRLFLELGLDPDTPNRVRANLNEFLPQHRRLESMRVQVAFNERLMVELGLFLEQLGTLRTAENEAHSAAEHASALLTALRTTRESLQGTVATLEGERVRLEAEDRRLGSARDALRRRYNFYTDRKVRLDASEAEVLRDGAERAREAAKLDLQHVHFAIELGDLRALQQEADALQLAIAAEQEQARPEREALERVGSAYRAVLERAVAQAQDQLEAVKHEKQALREHLDNLHALGLELAREQAAKRQLATELENFFANRERHRERLFAEELLQPREEASAAIERWRQAGQNAHAEAERAKAQRDAINIERQQGAADAQDIARDLSRAEQRLTQLTKELAEAEQREERIATHPEMQAALEASRAELDNSSTADRLRERVAWLIKQVLRLNLEGAEDERAAEYVRLHGLFPPSPDTETIAEQLRQHGVSTAVPATHWLAFNVADVDRANALIAAAPERYFGVMFDDSLDGTRAHAAASTLSSAQTPVVLTPLPTRRDESDSDAPGAGALGKLLGSGVSGQSAANGIHATGVNPASSEHDAQPSSRVILPRHAGAYNRTAAEAEAEALQSQVAARARGLDAFRTQHTEASRLLHELAEWQGAFGNGRLALLREQNRAEGQRCAALRDRQAANVTRQRELSTVAEALEKAERDHRQLESAAQNACTRLDHFNEQFDTVYASKRQQLDLLLARLKEIEVRLSALADEQRSAADSEPQLDARIAEARDLARDLRNELGQITYSGPIPAQVTEPLETLRPRYKHARERFEGRWMNSAKQGELKTKQEMIAARQKAQRETFAGLDTARAEQLLSDGNLPQVRVAAEAASENAQSELAIAQERLRMARETLRKLPALAESDRIGQDEPLPVSAAETARVLEAIQAESSRLQSDHESARTTLAETNSRLAGQKARVERLDALAKRLEDFDVASGGLALDLPSDDAQIMILVDNACTRLRQTRVAVDRERDQLRLHHERLSGVVQSEDFPHALNIPARTLFSALTLAELTQGNVAAERRQAVAEQTETLRAELAQMQQHRELIVGELLSEAEKAINLLRRAEKLSRMPETMSGWESEPFLRIRLALPHSQEDKLTRLRLFVDELLARGTVPDGVRLVFDAVLALVTERGMDATILKPETQRRKTRYPVREMSGWSEGERTTVAILLYCTLVKLRAQSRGHADRRAEVSALLLDNPVGKASKPEFLEMHRWIAGALGVQLIYATGINDPQALSVFPNRIRLAKNRLVPQTGELAVGVVGEQAESVITDIRIFDGLTPEEP